MPRIRSIKPDLPEDETLGAASRDARLLFVLLWTRADDYGNFRAAHALLRSQLYPYDDDATAAVVEGWLAELVSLGRVRLYTVDGQQYGSVVNWGKHQRIDHPGKPAVPLPPAVDGAPPAQSGGEVPQVSDSLGDPPSSSANFRDSERPSEGFGDLSETFPRVPETPGFSPLEVEVDKEEDREEDREGGCGGKPAQPPAKPPAYADDFEAWWSGWPRKADRRKADRAYVARRRAGVEHRTLVECRDRYVAECREKQREPDFIVHGATFLNGRWEDYRDGPLPTQRQYLAPYHRPAPPMPEAE